MGTGRTPLLDALKALVVAGTNKGHFWDLRSGSLADLWGTLNLTPNGGARLQRNGGATSVLGTDRFSTSDVGFAGSTEVTCIVFFRRGSALPTGTSSRFYNDFDGSFGQFINVQKSGDRIGFQTTSDAGIKAGLSTAAERMLVNDVAMLSISCRNNDANGVRLYINGVASAHANISTVGASITFNSSGISLPSSTAAASGTGLFYTEMVINKYLTDTEHAALYDEIVNQLTYELQPIVINSTYPTIGSSVWEARYGLLAGEVTMSAGQSLGQLDALKVSTGTHKSTTFLYGTTLCKGVQCVTAGDIILPDPKPGLGTTFGFWKYTALSATWAWTTSASTTITLAQDDKIIWADVNGQLALRKY